MIFTNPKRRPHNEPIYTKKLLLDHLLHHPCNPIISAAIMIENYQNRTLYGNALDVLKALPGGIDLQQDNETLQQKRLQPLTNDLFINAE
jgi:hypothetical protein